MRLTRYLAERTQVTDTCWLWSGSLNKGYGRAILKVDGQWRQVPAHRAVWQVLVGPIADGCDLHHECRVKHCVNPDHLQELTHVAHAEHHINLVCKRGHSLDDAYQTTRNGRPWRMCRPCQLERQARYRKNKK